MQITTIEQLKQIVKNDIIELPGFTDGTTFVVEARKPNMMKLMASGRIPNTLLSMSMDMFNGKGQQVINKSLEDVNSLKDLVNMMDIFADACLVNPSKKELEDAGLELNENQLMAILTYSQGGVKALENFRNKQEDNQSTQPGE